MLFIHFFTISIYCINQLKILYEIDNIIENNEQNYLSTDFGLYGTI